MKNIRKMYEILVGKLKRLDDSEDLVVGEKNIKTDI